MADTELSSPFENLQTWEHRQSGPLFLDDDRLLESGILSKLFVDHFELDARDERDKYDEMQESRAE